MALAASSRGAGSTNTGGQNTLVVTPTSNSAAWPGSMMQLCVAYDNSGASGTDPGSTVIDSLGNIWTAPFDLDTNTAGVANDGVTLATFVSYPKIGLTTADTITVSFNGITTVARAWTLTEVTTSVAGKYIANVAGSGVGTKATSTTPSITTGTLVIGDIVLGCMGAQGNASITADSDVSNGSWSTQQTSGVGVTTAGIEVASQNKVVTGTTAQTYNLTITSAKWVIFARVFRETTLPAYLTRHDQPRQAPIVRAGYW